MCRSQGSGSRFAGAATSEDGELRTFYLTILSYMLTVSRMHVPFWLELLLVCATFGCYCIGLGVGVYLTVLYYRPLLRRRRLRPNAGHADETLTGTQVDQLLNDLRSACKQEEVPGA